MGGREEKEKKRGKDEKGKMKPSRPETQIKSGSANDIVTEAPIAKLLHSAVLGLFRNTHAAWRLQ